MLIDWFTVIAQLVNFVVLLLLLKWLLFDRIVAAMEERRESIARKEEDAAEARREAEERAEELEREQHDLERRRDEIIDEARREAEERKQERLEQARAEIEDRQQGWRQSLRSRQDRLVDELAAATGEQAVAIARRAVRDLADRDFERSVLRAFAARLDDLSDEEEEELAGAVEDGVALVVHSSVEPDGEERDVLTGRLREIAGDSDRAVEWEHDPDLFAGVVVHAGDRRIGWTVDAYLEGLERAFSDLLEERIGGSDADDTEDQDAG